MSTIKKQILGYVSNTPYNINIQILNGTITELISSDSLNISDTTFRIKGTYSAGS